MQEKNLVILREKNDNSWISPAKPGEFPCFFQKIWVKQVVIREIGLRVSEKNQFQWSRFFLATQWFQAT